MNIFVIISGFIVTSTLSLNYNFDDEQVRARVDEKGTKETLTNQERWLQSTITGTEDDAEFNFNLVNFFRSIFLNNRTFPDNNNNNNPFITVPSSLPSPSPRPTVILPSSSPLPSLNVASPVPSSLPSPSGLKQFPPPVRRNGEDFPFIFDANTLTLNTSVIDYGFLTFAFLRTTLLGRAVRLMTYNQSLPAPVLSVQPGQTLRIKLINTLSPNKPPPRTVGNCYPPPGVNIRQLPPGTSPIGYINNPHGFHSVNLHTHGLQTTPYEDDVFLEIFPGKDHQFAFPVPTDHPSGLFWYHPHKHGAVATHASNGASGLLIVRGTLDEVMRNSGAREILLQINLLELNPMNDNPIDGGNGQTIFGNDPVSWACPQDGGFTTSHAFNTVLVNGRPVATAGLNTGWTTVSPIPTLLTENPGELVWLRIANTAASENWSLGFLGTGGSVNPSLVQAWVIEYDGISLPSPVPFQPGAMFIPNADNSNGIMLPPSGRISILVRAPTRPGSVITFGHAGSSSSSSPFPMIQIVYPRNARPPPPTFVSPSLPSILPGPTARNVPIPANTIVQRRSFALQISGFPGAPGPNPFSLSPFGFYINGQPYDEARIDVSHVLETSEEWQISNPTSVAHGFHIHINSFWVIAMFSNNDPSRTNILRSSYWADTVYISAFHTAVFRVKAVEWEGGFVGHCHILNHEEQGMMINIDIVKPGGEKLSPRTRGQLQLMAMTNHLGMGSGENSNGEHNLRGNSSSGLIDTNMNEHGGMLSSRHFPWPPPSNYLFQGNDALLHPIAHPDDPQFRHH